MNTFLSLGAILCLGMFAMLWMSTTVLSNASARILGGSRTGKRWMESASFLFWLRMFPPVFGIVATLGLVLPAFVTLEPRQTREKPDAYLIALAALSLFLLFMLAFRVIRLWWATERSVRVWQQGAQQIDCCAGVPVFRAAIPGCLFAVIGIVRPRIFISGLALASLEPEELHAAIFHELAHTRRFDNLKRLLLSATKMPWNPQHLDFAWAEAAECAADEHTVVRSGISALDLSSAIVKIARLRMAGDWSLVAASHLVIPTQPGAMSQRLRRLRLLLQDPVVASQRRSRSRLPMLVATVIAGYLIALPSLLSVTHRAMEWLVR